MKKKITDSMVERFKPGSGVLRVWDITTAGFGLRVTPSGAKSFIFQFTRADKTKVQGTIGTFPAWKVSNAREEARRLRKLHEDGKDAKADLKDKRNQKTFQALVDVWRDEEKPKLREHTQVCFESLLKKMGKAIPGLESRLVPDLGLADVKRIHKSIAAEGHTVTANRAVTMMGRLMNIAEREGWRPSGSNPVIRFEKPTEVARDRTLDEKELAALGDALAGMEDEKKLDTLIGDVFRFLLLSGLRKAEALNLRWEDIDMDGGTMTFKVHKTSKKAGKKELPLNSHLKEILNRRGKDKLSSFVFPGYFRRLKLKDKDGASKKETKGPTTGPLSSPKSAWAKVVQRAALGEWQGKGDKKEFVADCVIHDLRRTFNSTCAELGYPPQVFDTLLGHKLPGVTGTYTHMSARGILAEASQSTADWLSAALAGKHPKTGEKVITKESKKA